jgi:acyl-CoA thioester hydrolase
VRPPTGALVAEVAFRVPFHDVDSMQVVWHGNYVKYFELARTELEERLGLPVDVIEGMGLVCPIVECHARYLSPLRNGDRARCRAWILDWDRKLTLGYEVLNETTHRKSAEGYTVQVALRRDTFELVLELPDALVDPVRAAAGIRPGNGPGK